MRDEVDDKLIGTDHLVGPAASVKGKAGTSELSAKEENVENITARS